MADGVKMTTNDKALVSIIVRTKNEEKWISHCLEMLFMQDYKNFEVILVDNNSTDHTLEISQRYPIKKYKNIEKFFPGKALNIGIKESLGQYLCFISAHCIPKEKNWLSILVSGIEENKNFAGVYGRQLPLSFTGPIDKRDLLYVFGLDKRVQEKDHFFHNANSLIRRELWEKTPFDENLTNVEDRAWGREIIKSGYNLVYLPEAAVYHHHGLHQGNNLERAKGVISVIEQVDKIFNNENLPESMLPGNVPIAAFIPIKNSLNLNDSQMFLLQSTISDISKSKYLKKIFILSESKINLKNENIEIIFIDRKKIKNSDDLSIEELINSTLIEIELNKYYPDSIIYINYEYMNRPVNFFDDLICESQFNGYDTVFASLETYDHIWYKDNQDKFVQNEHSLKPRKGRNPTYKALYGLGTLVSCVYIRKKIFAGGKVSIISLKDSKFAERA